MKLKDASADTRAALDKLAQHTLEAYVGDLQREDDNDHDHRNYGCMRALEEAASILGIDLGGPESYCDALDAIHAYADNAYPPHSFPGCISFNQFRATRRLVDNLDALDIGADDVGAGWLYVEQLYIERTDDGRALLVLANCQWDADEPNETLEAILYQWGCEEGFCTTTDTNYDECDHTFDDGKCQHCDATSTAPVELLAAELLATYAREEHITDEDHRAMMGGGKGAPEALHAFMAAGAVSEYFADNTGGWVWVSFAIHEAAGARVLCVTTIDGCSIFRMGADGIAGDTAEEAAEALWSLCGDDRAFLIAEA